MSLEGIESNQQNMTTESSANRYDVLILGTGLTESITAAGLSKSGFKVVQVDPNNYYGGDEASLSLHELQQWARDSTPSESELSPFSSVSTHGSVPTRSQAFSVSVAPSIVPAQSNFVKCLVDSGVAKYGSFKLLDSLYSCHSGVVKEVPRSKVDVFKSKEISLVDKRKLMRFLQFAAGDYDGTQELTGNESMPFLDFLTSVFHLNEDLSLDVAFALALCRDRQDDTNFALKRVKRHLLSMGRYGPSPFLIGQYGGLGEIVQGFCRSCAVFGGTYILGRKLLSFDHPSVIQEDGKSNEYFKFILDDLDEPLFAKTVLASSRFLPFLLDDEKLTPVQTNRIGRSAFCIAILEGSLRLRPSEKLSASTTEPTVDTSVLVFTTPGGDQFQGSNRVVTALITGPGTLSCPDGNSIIHLSTFLGTNDSISGFQNENPEILLQPYLEELLRLGSAPPTSGARVLFTTFYNRDERVFDTAALENLQSRKIFISHPLPADYASIGDVAAEEASKIFMSIVNCLGYSEEISEMWPPPDQYGPDGEDA